MAYYATSPSHLVWHEGRVLIPQLLLSEFGYFSDDDSDFEEGIWVDKQKAGYIDPPDPHSIEKTVWLWEEEDGWQVSVRHEVVEFICPGWLLVGLDGCQYDGKHSGAA